MDILLSRDATGDELGMASKQCKWQWRSDKLSLSKLHLYYAHSYYTQHSFRRTRMNSCKVTAYSKRVPIFGDSLCLWDNFHTGNVELKSVGKRPSGNWIGHPWSKMNIVPVTLVITWLCVKAWFWGKKVSDLESFDGGQTCLCKCVDKGRFALLMLSALRVALFNDQMCRVWKIPLSHERPASAPEFNVIWHINIWGLGLNAPVLTLIVMICIAFCNVTICSRDRVYFLQMLCNKMWTCQYNITHLSLSTRSYETHLPQNFNLNEDVSDCCLYFSLGGRES